MRKLIESACILALTAALSACGSQTKQEQNSGQPPETAAPADNGTVDQSAAVNVAAASATPVAAQAAGAPPPAFTPCTTCHSPNPGQNGIGPSLAGVFGTKAAEVAGYDFSSAMKNSGLTWDAPTLDRYLKSPRTVVPGTKMTFAGITDDAKRAAVIAYLQSIK